MALKEMHRFVEGLFQQKS
jgi:hypothetical protein